MNRIIALFGLVSLMGFGLAQGDAVAQIATNEAQKSPWGPADEIGTLNMMTDASRLDVLKRIAGGKVYDLGVDLFPGMPYLLWSIRRSQLSNLHDACTRTGPG